jgi:hypothetical protein
VTTQVDDIQLGELALSKNLLEQILWELRRGREYGGTGDMQRAFWDAGKSAELSFDNFNSVGIFNLSAAPIRVAFSPNQSDKDRTSQVTIRPQGHIILPYRGNALSVSTTDGTAGSALVVPFSEPQPASASLLGADAPSGLGEGWEAHSLVAAASNNAAVVKAAAGQVGGYIITNLAAAARHVKLYDKASAAPAPAADMAALKLRISLPAGAMANVEFRRAVDFDTGIGVATVTGVADNDNTGVAASDLVINLLYR